MLFQVTAIILLLVFYGCYFGKMFLQKRQGIQTDQIGKGKTGTAKVIETLMKITTILVPLVEVICIIKENYTFCKLFLVITVFLLALHKLCSIINS